MNRPNIMMIMTDQQHADCVGYRGHPDVRTPNIDRLAEGGVRFDSAFTCHGTCVPSRVSYFTGTYPHVHGVFGNDLAPIPREWLSLPTYLQPFGYQTAIIGKKHLPNWPTHGFQYERVCYHADAPLRNLHYYNYLKRHGLHAYYDDLGDVEKFCLGDEAIPTEHSMENWTADETIRYLEEERDADRPFFMMTSFERPHPPHTPPPDCPFQYDPEELTLPANAEETDSTFFFDRNVELKWRTSVHGEKTLRLALSKYYSLISLIDDNIGRILSCLDQLGLRQDTLIVFCTDHGDFAGEYSRMAKGFPYDALHRVPFVWHWPGRLQEGKVEQALVETVDFSATVCDLLDVPIPRTVQGRSLAGALTSDESIDRDAVFFETIGVKTVRTRTHKLNYAFTEHGEQAELFDLENDPHEYSNVYEDPAYSGVRDTLLRRLLDWWIETQQPVNFAPGNESLPNTHWFSGT